MNSYKTEVLSKICYTELVYERINKKLNSKRSKDEIEKMIYELIAQTHASQFQKRGKNIYVTNHDRNISITINSNTHRVITINSDERTKLNNKLLKL
ncbi:MAG: DUF3781 domain-containing protein [Bacteroidetes bacterium]|nr:DUF3781 domain-containing protein [Bacteroidota bacterium]MBU2466347.1 DUF3781 domain-containing protein [Bacteroidota bacterium]MBU2556781.1 DUF3781 domain-containing protein [Bacteroidota bacterium]